MAAKKSAKYPHQWADGSWHSIPYAQHMANERAKAGNPLSLPDPPPGTYDPSIDYNSGAAERGWGQTQNDAQTAYEQGQQDYGLGLGALTRGRDRTQADISSSYARENEDYGLRTKELGRGYGILGRQQAEGAAQRGITSAGLLGKSAAVRGENQAREQSTIDLGHNRTQSDLLTAQKRTNEDFDVGKTGLDLGNARTFGGFNGQTVLNPITGQPEYGSLITGVKRAGDENIAFQRASSDQRSQQAQAMGYVSPLTKPIGGVSIGGTALTPQMWQSGMFLDALLAGSRQQAAQKKKPPAKGRQVGIGG